MIESTISSPSPIAMAPKESATRLMRLGGVAGEDDLVDAAGVEEAAHRLARVLVLGGRGVGQVVQAAVHVGVLEAVGVIHGLDHGRGFCAEAALSR